MEQGLKPSETTSFFAPSRIEHYRVVPLKLALNQLELKLSQVKSSFLFCLAGLCCFVWSCLASVRACCISLFASEFVLSVWR